MEYLRRTVRFGSGGQPTWVALVTACRPRRSWTSLATMQAPSTTPRPTQLETCGPSHFRAQCGQQSNTFMVDWTAPVGGGDVTVYASGLAAGCQGRAATNTPAPRSPSRGQIVVEVGGCTYDFACNYNPEAAFDDGSCEVVSCALQGDLNGDLAVTTSDLLIFLSVFGETLDLVGFATLSQTLATCVRTSTSSPELGNSCSPVGWWRLP